MIEATKNFVESNYPGAVVVYGDTDSVMVKFGVSTVAEALKLGPEAAKRVTETLFVRPISLAFEKIYYPYLLINKKRYAGLYWTNAEKHDKLDVKGLENARRDNCGLVRNTMDRCLEFIIENRNIPGAVEYAKNTVRDLLTNKVDLSLLIITKSLATAPEMYGSKQAHVELALRMKKRDPGSAPVSGDRVPFVYILTEKNAKAFEKSEHPLYVMENNLPIDANYYLEQQLRKPLERLFEHLIPDTSVLFHGTHTLHIVKTMPTNKTGLLKFTVKKFTCLKCQKVLEDSRPVCESCESSRPKFKEEAETKVNEKQELYDKYLQQCKDCQGNKYEEVICSNADCEIFYRRLQVKKDLASVKEAMKRFEF
jgi:DNA polymerase delta subunit 1